MRTIILVLLISCSVLSSSGQYKWINPLPGGVTINAMDFSDSLNGIAVGDVGTIAYTTDGGGSWSLGESSTFFDVRAVRVFSSNVAYACAENEFLRTTDGGEHWVNVCKDTNFLFRNFSFSTLFDGFAVVWSNNEYEYVIAKTNNGGVNWFICDQPMMASRRVATSSQNKAIIINNGLLYKTVNGGDNFYPVNGDFENFVFTTVYHYHETTWFAAGIRFNGDFDETSLLFVSYDDGENWYKSYESPSSRINSMDFYGKRIIMSTGGSLIIESSDEGITWQTKDVPNLITSSKCISAISENDAVLFAESLLYKKDVANDEWVKISPFYPVEIHAVSMVDSLHTFAVGLAPYLNQNSVLPKTAVFKTSNGGNNWECQFPFDYYVTDVSFCDTLNGMILNNLANDTLFITHDGGKSWNGIYVPILQNSFKVSYTSPLRAYLQTVYDLFRTDDGGVTWQKKVLPNCGRTRIQFINDSIGYVAGYWNYDFYNDAGYFKTMDGGESWQFFKHREERPYTQVIHFPDTTIGFVIKGLFPIELWKVSLHNNFWTKIYTFDYQNDPTNHCVWFADSLTGYVLDSEMGYRSKLSMTNDGGKNWEVIGLFPHVRKMVFSNSKNGLVFGYQSRILRINPNISPYNNPRPQQQNHKNITVFPNPANEYLIIMIDDPSIKTEAISVYDCNGRLQLTSLNNNFNNVFKINTTSLRSGLYVFTINGSNQHFSGKFIVE